MVFGSILGKSNKEKIFLGSPEAEAEATSNSRISLKDVYEDYHDLLPQLSAEKFIVVGRKGSGKSAFAEYVCSLSKSQPNLFCQFIRSTDFGLEKIIQHGNDTGHAIDGESFFKWLIYTNILKLFAFNEATKQSKDFELLRQFLQKNSGYININELEVKQLISKHGFDVSTEQFKRFFKAALNKNIEIKSERAPYYKLIPHLEEVIVKVMTSQEELQNENSYALFFDDLDVGFSINNQESVNSVVSLIRACRHINNEIFGKNNLRAKAVILLRDDIEQYISSRFADTAKIFASYKATINWYQNEYVSDPNHEDNLNLKKFINKRISHAFDKAEIKNNSQSPWDWLVKSDINSDKSSFKYVASQTLFRPRDLLLFFKPLSESDYSYPLSRYEINGLVNAYSAELSKEIKNELSSFFDGNTIEMIFSALGDLSKNSNSYENSIQIINKHCNDVNAAELLEYLFNRSIIGTTDAKGWYTFKCREPISGAQSTHLNKTHSIVIQYGIRAYLMSRYV